MLADLPKLIGRGFVVGFVLPAALFCLYVQYLSFSVPDLENLDKSMESLKITPFILSVLLLSVALMAINRSIIRILEGYGRLNPFRILKLVQIAIFQWRVLPLLVEAKRIEKSRDDKLNSEPKFKDFSIKLSRATQSYPLERDLLLPTAFGNSMRSFETYSLDIYGLDAIAAWPRLFLSLPKDVKDQIQDGKSIIDFSSNLFVLSIVAICLYAYKYYDNISNINNLYIVLLPLICAAYSWMNLPVAARQWGVKVKSAIDVFRPKLAKDLGLDFPESSEKEREMWRHVSRQIIFRSEPAYRSLNEFRKKEKTKRKPYEPLIKNKVK